MIEIIINADEYLAGQADCRSGIPHSSFRGDSYDAGYSAQYTLEQVIGARHDESK